MKGDFERKSRIVLSPMNLQKRATFSIPKCSLSISKSETEACVLLSFSSAYGVDFPHPRWSNWIMSNFLDQNICGMMADFLHQVRHE